MNDVKYNWTTKEILAIYHRPLLELIYDAQTMFRKYHKIGEVQMSSLLSIKTGGCTEDCAYCPQAARHHTDIKVHKLLSVDEVSEAADKAKAGGSTRMCLGAAWREVRDNSDFDRIIDMVKTNNQKDMQVCCTLGMITENQAQRLADAGLYAYNHNVDTSEENYDSIITTRTYDDRLNTLKHARNAGITLCTGGIIGMGESVEDRANMLLTLANMDPHPESVPINALVPVAGTPLEDQPPVPAWELARMIATARIVMPKSVVRLSAGRQRIGIEGQALCFLAGANSIFAGDKLLTTANPEFNEDLEMFKILGLTPKEHTTECNHSVADMSKA